MKGRTIKRLRLIGLCYDLRRDDIEEYAYIALEGQDEETRQSLSEYDSIDPELSFPRSAEVDEPLLIEFEDGDVLEIISPRVTEYRMSMNHISWWIDTGINKPNVDAGILFAPCVGKKIDSVGIETYLSKEDPMYGLYDIEKEIVSKMVIRLEDGSGICINGWYGYCHLAYITADNKVETLPFRELKKALFNWEDLHIDGVSGFRAKTGTFNFGKKGAEHSDSPFMTLSHQKGDSVMHISVEDFLLFDWSIIIAIRDWFDEYGYYEFDKKQWNVILSNGEEILSYETFDDLFDYFMGLKIKDNRDSDIFLYRLNNSGVTFWRKRSLFSQQLKDMREWSDLVLTDDDVLYIHGF